MSKKFPINTLVGKIIILNVTGYHDNPFAFEVAGRVRLVRGEDSGRIWVGSFNCDPHYLVQRDTFTNKKGFYTLFLKDNQPVEKTTVLSVSNELLKQQESLIEHIRSQELDYGEELDIPSQELIVGWIEAWFDTLAYELGNPMKEE